jgi:3-hydroxyacyl-[acyl-carrier-protein] dehydratase
MWMEGSIAVDFTILKQNMYSYILNHLPYKSSFRFVDHISSLDADGVTGDYTLHKDAFFYKDHFEGNAVTPGVIIVEIMAQIGLVVLGIYLLLNGTENVDIPGEERLLPLLTSTEVSFYKMVFPGQKVTVISKKQYFRFGKLKCYVEMRDERQELVAKGVFAGMIKKTDKKNYLS